MPSKPSLFGSQVARRILVSFVLAALIPIVILGLLSFQQVSGQLRAQTARSLQSESKDYAMQWMERLTLAEKALRLAAIQIENAGQDLHHPHPENPSGSDTQFTALTLIGPAGETRQLLGTVPLAPALGETERREIRLGKTLLKPAAGSEAGSGRLWMAILADEHHPSGGILVGELKRELVWQGEDIEPNVLWALAADGGMWFASAPGFTPPPELRAPIAQSNSGQLAWTATGGPYAGAYWKLPMKAFFLAPDLIFVLAQPEALAFNAMRQFSEIYPPVIVLAVLIVALLSTKLIARQLTPLERLKAATRRIAEGDFSGEVKIESRDEFQALGESFNTMTRRLRGQFDMISTMAEIDRHILSAFNAEELIDTALWRLPAILLCDLISIARIDPETLGVRDIRTQRGGQEREILTMPMALSQADLAALLAAQDGAMEIDGGKEMPPYLQVLGLDRHWRLLVIPVFIDGKLSATISLGYPASTLVPPESLEAARTVGDRIAVALSHVAWEEKLYHQSHYDALTGLPNRLVLYDRIRLELARAQRDEIQFAVLFIDLDRFKNINDSLGLPAGDELLSQVSRILLHAVRASDLVVRIGGDEFVVVVTDIHIHPNPAALVSTLAEKLLSALKQTLYIAGYPMTITASLGIAMFPSDGSSKADLLKNADTAMFHAKSSGRATFRFYSKELNATALENIELEHELRLAIAKGELLLHYQPKVNLAGQIVGAEALIRWAHPVRGMISPGRFIPLAEESGLIIEIGEWALEQTCLWVNSCAAQGLSPVRVSVNLSAIEFKRPDLVKRTAEILANTGVNPQSVELELTESVAIGDTKVCIARMNDLKSTGLHLAMDDFGTGFSSLSYLKELPLDVLKIDQSFVRQLESKASSQAIVRAILALADGLGMETVAEGVETEAQLEFLKEHHCGIFQGYFFSRPVPSDDFVKLLLGGGFKKV